MVLQQMSFVEKLSHLRGSLIALYVQQTYSVENEWTFHVSVIVKIYFPLLCENNGKCIETMHALCHV